MARDKPAKARKDAKRDMRQEGFTTAKECPPHRGPWDSRGPLKDEHGRSYNEYKCPQCGQEMPRYYYPD